ncbi:MAG: PadR family transcriptional regulator [Thermoplasmata archaeon]|nr:MAG: PadR family transcriptional regulator [Thermoplasmata archaeon]
MKVPILKYFMMKTLSEGKATGYKIIKKCEDILGYKPSTGSIYPLLKGMEREKIIKGERKGRGTVYSITDKGKKMLREVEKIKKDFYQKLQHYAASMAEIFGDKELKKFSEQDMHVIGKKFSLLKIGRLVMELDKKGIATKKIKKILDEAYTKLLALKEEKNDGSK